MVSTKRMFLNYPIFPGFCRTTLSEFPDRPLRREGVCLKVQLLSENIVTPDSFSSLNFEMFLPEQQK